MLGYIRPFKPYMRFYEYEIYRSFYCGLCKNLGKNYGQIFRNLLSYDFVFLGLIHSGINGSCETIKAQRCIVHPLRKKNCLCLVNNLDYTSAATVISVYHKICDNISDSKFIAKFIYKILKLFLENGYKKASGLYPELSEIVELYMSKQRKLESENCSNIDKACEPTAQIMAAIAKGISDDMNTSENLYNFGYHLGRFVYLADARDDLEKDIKHKRYNPLYLNFKDIESAKKFADENINMSLSMLSEFYSNIPLKKHKDITDNIVYLGLKNYKSLNNRRFKRASNKSFEI